jgi:hypothetical protein
VNGYKKDERFPIGERGDRGVRRGVPNANMRKVHAQQKYSLIPPFHKRSHLFPFIFVFQQVDQVVVETF